MDRNNSAYDHNQHHRSVAKRDKYMYLNVWIKTIVPMITISNIDLEPNGNTYSTGNAFRLCTLIHIIIHNK